MNNGDIIDIHGFIRICAHLPTGMILRCSAVCKNWHRLSQSDDLWIIIMKYELKGENGLSLRKNMALNQKIIMIWKKEFNEKYGSANVKDVYMRMRREQIRIASKGNRIYRDRMRIFAPGPVLRNQKIYV